MVHHTAFFNSNPVGGGEAPEFHQLAKGVPVVVQLFTTHTGDRTAVGRKHLVSPSQGFPVEQKNPIRNFCIPSRSSFHQHRWWWSNCGRYWDSQELGQDQEKPVTTSIDLPPKVSGGGGIFNSSGSPGPGGTGGGVERGSPDHFSACVQTGVWTRTWRAGIRRRC